MKGLILKDFLNMRKTIGFVGLLTVFYTALSIVNKSPWLLNFLTVMLAVIFPPNALAYDERAKWDVYALTRPVSRRHIVLSKYIVGLIPAALGCALSIAAQCLFSLSEPLDAVVNSLLFFCIGIILLAVTLPILFKYGSEKARLVMMTAILLPMFLSFLFQGSLDAASQTAIRALPVVIPAAAAAALALSIAVSLGIYRKKEL